MAIKVSGPLVCRPLCSCKHNYCNVIYIRIPFHSCSYFRRLYMCTAVVSVLVSVLYNAWTTTTHLYILPTGLLTFVWEEEEEKKENKTGSCFILYYDNKALPYKYYMHKQIYLGFQEVVFNLIVIGFCVFELQLQPHDHIRSLPIVISSG